MHLSLQRKHGFDIAVKATLSFFQSGLSIEAKLHFQRMAVDGCIKVDVRN